MKQWKKLLASVLSLSLFFGLVACSGGDTQPSGKAASSGSQGSGELTLALRGGTYAEVIKKALPDFEAKHQVKIKVLELAEKDLYSGIALDAVNPKGAYDLVMVDGSWMAQFTENGVLADLSALGYELDDDIIPATTKIAFVDGKPYLAPFYGNVTVLMFNKENVEQAGYTKEKIQSLEDVLKICQHAKAASKQGFIYRGDGANNLVVDFLPILLAHGAWVVNEKNAPTVNTPEFQKAVHFYLDLIATGQAQVKDDLIAAIDQGSGTMAIGWPGWYMPSDTSKGDYIALQGRTTPEAKAFNSNVYGIWALGIPQNSQNQELAAELLKHLMDKEVQLKSIDFGGVPCRYSALKNPEVLKKYPHYSVVCDALDSGVYRPVMEKWTEFYTVLGAELDNIIHGQKTVEQGLQDAQSKLEQLK